ncbi:MAG TPA: ATP-binding protein [Thioalkalivibrio sp.]|nr:ATP-binding protein [Thioalkalivibrio sp.]
MAKGKGLTDIQPLAPEALYQATDLAALDFATTAELPEHTEAVGQQRALEAIRFGVGIAHHGYNLFVAGSTGLGKHTVVERELAARAAKGPVPDDWCYVNNFEAPHRPRALRLPTGKARALSQDMDQLVDDLLSAIPAAFQGDEYRTRAQEINDEFKERQDDAFLSLDEEAQKRDITILRTPTGYTLAPLKDGEVVGPEEFEALAEEEQDKIEKSVDELRARLRETIRQIPLWQKEMHQKVKALNREVTDVTVSQIMRGLTEKYADLDGVPAYLEAVRQDVIDNVDAFRQQGEAVEVAGRKVELAPDFNRYKVNVLVDHSDNGGAPVVHEDNPTYLNLIGRIEHIAQFGTLLTDFTLIKAGALHRASGGYLVLYARDVLMNAFAWEGLKRVLRSREVRLESLERMLSLASTTSLEPESIPVDVKVVLVGDRMLYYLLKAYDPEFALLFKVAADFSEDIDRSPENTRLMANLIGTVQRQEALRPLTREAVGRLIEHLARTAADGEKVSVHMGNLCDLMREADYWAGEDGDSKATHAAHVKKAIDQRIYRLDQIRERVHESILRDIQLVDTAGERVGQVNGLSVSQLGDYAFGRPSRITATARLGEGKFIDIEREVKLGGPIHSKGVMILSSYLGYRYASEAPLSVSASLVFEQSYGQIEGDSASVAELCALLSALGEIPLRQSLAVTGSVNQHGEVQAIGGVNEKIEGFFDICQGRGLSEGQGVIIPASNAAHLMLREDVVAAVREGRFAVYPVRHVEEAMSLLCGLEPGEPGTTGAFPPETFNGRVAARLQALTRKRLAFIAKSRGMDERDGDDQS